MHRQTIAEGSFQRFAKKNQWPSVDGVNRAIADWERQPGLWTLLLLLLSPLASAAAIELSGWVERVRLEPYGLTLRAKIDTGAQHSSLNAADIEFLVKEGEDYARFRVVNGKGDQAVLEEPLVRQAKIKQHGGESEQRAVILLSICLGKVRKRVEVNLIDRSGFNYQMLIGRSFLKDDFLVDAAKTFRLKPQCKN
jgi:hypothetical protein